MDKEKSNDVGIFKQLIKTSPFYDDTWLAYPKSMLNRVRAKRHKAMFTCWWEPKSNCAPTNENNFMALTLWMRRKYMGQKAYLRHALEKT